MRSGRNNHTYVKAKDLRPGMVVSVKRNNIATLNSDLTIEEVRRAADVVETERAKVAKTKARPALRDATERLLSALDAIEYEGREARLVRYAGQRRFHAYASSAELRYLRQAISGEREGE